MSRRRRAAGVLIPVLAVSALTVSLTTTAGAATGSVRGLTAKALTVATSYAGSKSTTGRLAQSDQALLKRTDSKLVNVVVKLDYDASASYTGTIKGLAATSPRVTGKQLTGKSAAETAYAAYTKGIDSRFRSDVAKQISGARLGRSLTTVYGGVALRVPANQVAALLKLPNVSAVQADALNQPQTDSSTTFIGAPTLWAKEGGQALAGQGVIFGDLDTGLWPEHPSFADTGLLSAPPAKADGTPRTCDFGDNPLTPATDVFACTNKLIGGEPFLDTYNALNGDELYPDSARDSDGHGTHTSSTAAGDVVTNAPIFGVNRGPISGVAPGAWVSEYKVCGPQGCYSSDSAAAVQQAVLDGVDVINFSIGGGTNPYSDPVELAFLDAYAAGVTVAASAGNDGPTAATTGHNSPWVITVAASTQAREFQSTLTLTDGSASTVLTGSSITAGAGPAPIVLASAAPYNNAFCGSAAPTGLFAGKIVACQRGGGVGRVQKGFNIRQGGAVGMILYNLPLADTETDNHWLPVVHLADGTAFLAFMSSHTGVTGSFTAGVKAFGPGDVMASFSSRGPGGQFLKPDITAPGVQILAGHSPTPCPVDCGPPGEYYQAIAGTSMSSPHIAGSAILVQALHPTWGPGAIKSALMSTATTNVVKEDTVTPADPFDDGAGRVDLNKAGSAPVVFQDSAANMFVNGSNPLTAINVNTPAVNLPTMPGSVTVKRTATNLSNKAWTFRVGTQAPKGSSITVSPKTGTIRPGQSKVFTITVKSSAPTGQYFGQVLLSGDGAPNVHLPVAFFNRQGAIALAQSCSPTTINLGSSTSCTVTAQNTSFDPAVVSATTKVGNQLEITGATGATVNGAGTAASAGPVTLAGKSDAAPSIAPGVSPAGYLPLELFGITPTPIGDEEIQNYNVPPFVFAGHTYSVVGVDSNGYIVAGGGTGQDNDFVPQTFPDTTRPNGVMAPFWTDLDGSGAPGIRAATLTDGVNTWLVVQWDVNVFGTNSHRTMQVWIGVNGVEDVSYTYDPGQLPADPNGQLFNVGVENASGTAGDQIAGLPTEDLVVTSTPGAPGGTLTYSLTAKGILKGKPLVTTNVLSDNVAGTTSTSTQVTVIRR